MDAAWACRTANGGIRTVRYTIAMGSGSVPRFIQDVGRIIQDVRAALRMTQDELSRLSGVSQSQISRIERGRVSDLRIDVLDRLLTALGIRYWLERSRPASRARRRTSSTRAAPPTPVDGSGRRSGSSSGRSRLGATAHAVGSICSRITLTRKALLVVEIKTEIVDIGAIERTLNWYRREAFRVARRFGWQPRQVNAALLLLDSRSNDDRVTSNQTVFRQAFPARAPQLREVIAGSGSPPVEDFLAMIDPRSRRRDWIRATHVDGRRTASAYLDYIDAARRLERHRR